MTNLRLAACLAAVCALTACTRPNPNAALQPDENPGFGQAHFPVSCTASAQREFDVALAMLHSFHYPNTVKAFTKTAAIDPECAMAHWGIAISQLPNPLVGPWDDAVLQRGLDAVAKGKTLAKTEREKAWLAALEMFFKDYRSRKQEDRTRAYEIAMEALQRKYPDDVEAAAFYALALNQSVSLADKTHSRQRKAGELLEKFAAKYPAHPGIAHYLIHSYDYRPLAEKALPAAKRYAGLAPASPHARHMPAHVYSMLGMWKESIAANQAALAKDRNDGSNPAAAAHYYDFLVYAYLQRGQDREARLLADRLQATPNPSAALIDAAFAAPIARYALERMDWKAASLLEPRKSRYPYTEAIGVFTHAMGKVNTGKFKDARDDIARLQQLRETDKQHGQDYWAGQTQMLERAASAWLALAEGDKGKAQRLMREAADLQDGSEKHVAMENRLYPMRELLGYLLLELNEAQPALAEFEASLKDYPNRLRGFYGAAIAAELAGHPDRARDYYEKLEKLAQEAGGRRPEFDRAREFLAKQSNLPKN